MDQHAREESRARNIFGKEIGTLGRDKVRRNLVLVVLNEIRCMILCIIYEFIHAKGSSSAGFLLLSTGHLGRLCEQLETND